MPFPRTREGAALDSVMSASGGFGFAGLGLDEVLRHIPAAVVVVEAGSRAIVYSNASAKEMTEELIGGPIPPGLTEDWEIFHPDGRPYRGEEWPLIRSMTTGEIVAGEEYFNVRPDGTRLSIRCSSSPVYGESGEIAGGVLVMNDVTSEKSAWEQLVHHACLLDLVEDAVIGTDAQLRLTVWNRGAERLYGYAANEVVGRDARDIASYEGDASRQALDAELLDRGRSSTEITAYRRDGTRVDVQLAAAGVRGERGEVIGYLGIHRDVTERRRAEAALQASQRQIKTVLDSITDAFVAVDRDWRYTYVNDRALHRMQERTGQPLKVEDVLGRSMWEMFPDVVDTEIHRGYQQAMREQRVVEFETWFAPTGEWIEAHAYPSGEGLSIYYRNVSERKRATEERERAARRHAEVAGLGGRALASDDLRSLMDEAAAMCMRMLDVEFAGVHERLPGGGELVLRAGAGWRPEAVGSATSCSGRGSPMGYTLESGEPLVSEDMACDGRFDASSVLTDHGAAAALCVLIGGRDEPFGVLGAFAARPRSFSGMDVDFAQAVANVLAAAAERAKAGERLTEVREAERRRLARDLHDDALQDLSETLARAAAAAPGSGDVDDRLADVVASLRRIGSHLRGAIYDLRLGAEESRPFPELLEAFVDAQRALAEGVEIELRVGDGAPAGSLGRRGTEVLRIVGEAVLNARRHAGAGQIRVDVRASARRLDVEVSDDGAGFDTGRLPGPTGGTGIARMRERSAQLDGELHITSEPGAGTRVRLELPLTGVGEVVERQVRILLVEDHAAVREAMAGMFEREPDFTVVGQAPSLADARELLHGVDVAVVDLGLPDGDGSDLIEELRDASPRAQALVLSASLNREQTARAIERGAAAMLDKTAHLDEIVDAVRRLRAGETVLALDDVVELLGYAGRRREEERADRDAIERLTPRELEVLEALGEGLDSQAIARRLNITLRTQRNHVASILTKLGVHTQLQAVLFAIRYGVIEIR